jgi:RecB family endonuclease NucS
MYHVRLHAYVVIEIKLGEYKVEYLGQLKNYVKLVNEIERDENIDRQTIGILLCKSANETIVKTTMEDETVPLILSKYILLDEIKTILEK